MSYLEFHLLFNVPAVLALGWLTRKRLTREHVKWIAVVALIVLAFASLFDHYAIRRGLWDFDESRILFRVARVPIEEYLFFLFAALETCLCVLLFTPATAHGNDLS